MGYGRSSEESRATPSRHMATASFDPIDCHGDERDRPGNQSLQKHEPTHTNGNNTF
ncbi:hypothetical protein HMPREF9622_01566 [Cutibacterium modestum HL037PA3]|uniref:Uncharacterized protein n=1 Tax=Cutibacterium modestum HL044PA1 TaxID=765109 RepID=A0ABP2K6X6_9ACTN|nr:hypothetical protein HMPREF9621_01649 [Cutibacterium modestum HL037PA2]EFS92691.1 hypothetical protein HMPREF9607_01222 [Cutibacterium modestum HL044PA1]EFT15360.1 hypothetical protein HMPREF9622_01566 [Cutibacterium modestum HL037PA3]